LKDTLSAQAGELRALMPLLDEQHDALTRADSAAVADVLVRQDPILRRFLRLDQKRQALATALATQAGLPAVDVALSALLGHLPGAPATVAALTTLRAELRQLLEAAAARNRRNALVLDRATAIIAGLVRAVMAPPPEPAPVYVATGRPARRSADSRVLDRRA
jgi:flagellar biosynthesis/type III secretory pathway chaperone